jgi:IS30 family transposase
MVSAANAQALATLRTELVRRQGIIQSQVDQRQVLLDALTQRIAQIDQALLGSLTPDQETALALALAKLPG